jgi:hypothetical protein
MARAVGLRKVLRRSDYIGEKVLIVLFLFWEGGVCDTLYTYFVWKQVSIEKEQQYIGTEMCLVL